MPVWNEPKERKKPILPDSFFRISASVSCMDLCHLESQVKEAEKAGVSFFHYDVVDGRFNHCFILGETTLEQMRAVTSLPIEVHLAVYEPERHIERFAKAGADIITVHYETSKNPRELFELIRKCGCEPALAYKSDTAPGDDFEELAADLSMVLKLTVSPGFSGQAMQMQAVKHIQEMRKRLNAKNLHTAIQADGNISLSTIPLVAKAGATIFTGGTSGLFTRKKSIAENLSAMLHAAEITKGQQ